MNDTLYLKAEKNISVQTADVRMQDLGEMWCSNSALLSRCMALRFLRMDGERCVASVVDVIRIIEEQISGVTVESIGEADFVIEYKPQKQRKAFWEWGKFLLVWLVLFFGSGFAIATFNEDVSVMKVFEGLHEDLTGLKRTGITRLETGYAIGLSTGIMIFYDHLSKRKESADPTPLDVEMRTYEKELYTTMIDNAARQKRQSQKRGNAK